MGIWVAKLASRPFPHPVWAGIPVAISAAKSHPLRMRKSHPLRMRKSHPLRMRKSHPDARPGLLIRTRLDTLLPAVSSHTGVHPAVGLHRATGTSSASPAGCPARHLRLVRPPSILPSRTRRPRTRAPRSSSCGSDVAGMGTGRHPLMACN
jgi:hypothetical protein